MRLCIPPDGVGASHLVVVGGTPSTLATLRDLDDGRIQVRSVEIEERHTSRDAEVNLAWADVVVIWGSAPIGHKTTRLYKGPKVVQMARRSFAALADEVRRSVERDR